jgi:hypothetical protein
MYELLCQDALLLQKEATEYLKYYTCSVTDSVILVTLLSHVAAAKLLPFLLQSIVSNVNFGSSCRSPEAVHRGRSHCQGAERIDHST